MTRAWVLAIALGCGVLAACESARDQGAGGQAGASAGLGPRAVTVLAPAVPLGTRPDPAAVHAVPIGDSPARGAADAWVTVVALTEYDCIFCTRVDAELEGLRRDLGADLRVVVKHNPMPFRPRSWAAAVAAECGREQGRFWELHDLLFESPRRLGDAGLAALAEEAGIEMTAWRACVAAERPRPRIAADQALAGRLAARTTPTLFVNGRALAGAIAPGVLRQVVDEELARARASGLARGDYYERAVAKAGSVR